MSVYLTDDRLTADSTEELMTFATEVLGLKAGNVKLKGASVDWHFCLNNTAQAQARQCGAVEKTTNKEQAR